MPYPIPHPFYSEDIPDEEHISPEEREARDKVLDHIFLEDAWLEYARFNISQLRGLIPIDSIYKKSKD